MRDLGGGTLGVSLGTVELGVDDGVEPGAYNRLTIRDSGHGMDGTTAEQAMKPFFTTRPGGLGLGLNICRTIVEAHRGRLFFAGREGGGTIFTLELPIACP